MKLKKREKGVKDAKENGEANRRWAKHKEQPRRDPVKEQQARMDAFEARFKAEQRERERNLETASKDPVAAHSVGLPYSGPEMPDKGQKNGSCNVTACQMPLAGRPQFWMQNLMVQNGRNYYCSTCARRMDEWDAECVRRGENKPGGYGLNEYGYRCSPDEDNDKLLRVA